MIVFPSLLFFSKNGVLVFQTPETFMWKAFQPEHRWVFDCFLGVLCVLGDLKPLLCKDFRILIDVAGLVLK
jgi:hypothetical protein